MYVYVFLCASVMFDKEYVLTELQKSVFKAIFMLFFQVDIFRFKVSIYKRQWLIVRDSL